MTVTAALRLRLVRDVAALIAAADPDDGRSRARAEAALRPIIELREQVGRRKRRRKAASAAAAAARAVAP